MKIAAIIAEYNPFHNGHAYQIEETRRITGADYIAVAMSPDFVQRGEPALIDKYARTRMALSCGADLVLELPVCYACASAEYFAEGAISLLEQLGCVDVLSFGCETPDAGLFRILADCLNGETETYRANLLRFQKQGLTYPQARARALRLDLETRAAADSHTRQSGRSRLRHDLGTQAAAASSPRRDSSWPTHAASPEALSDFLSQPNNILGLEYTRALRRIGSSIEILPLRRIGSGYHSLDLSGRYCSASAIRGAVTARYVPNSGHGDRHTHESQRRAIPNYADDSAVGSPNHAKPDCSNDIASGATRTDDVAAILSQSHDRSGCTHAVASGATRTGDAAAILSQSHDRSGCTHAVASGTVGTAALSACVPEKALSILRAEAEQNRLARMEDFSLLLHYRLLSETDFSRYLDVSADLSDRIANLLPQYRDSEQFAALIKTRQWTLARIRRALLHILLDITVEDTNRCRALGGTFYARILGFRRDAVPLLHEIKRSSRIPLLSRISDAQKILDGSASRMFAQDLYASHLYQLPASTLRGCGIVSEYTRSPILL